MEIFTTTPCWLRGSDVVEATCRKITGIKGWHETSADGLFTMSQVECVGACVNAPVRWMTTTMKIWTAPQPSACWRRWPGVSGQSPAA